MPVVEDEARVKNSVKSAVPEKLYVFCGTEPYLKEFYLNTLIKSCVAEGFEVFNLKQFDGATASWCGIFLLRRSRRRTARRSRIISPAYRKARF